MNEKGIYHYETPVDPPAEKPVCPPVCETEPHHFEGFEPILSDETMVAKQEDANSDADSKVSSTEAQGDNDAENASEDSPSDTPVTGNEPKREIKYRVSDTVEEMARYKATVYAIRIIKILKKKDHGDKAVDIDNFEYEYEQLVASNLIKDPDETLDELHASSHAGTYIRYAAPELLKYYNGTSAFDTIEALMEDAFQRKAEEDNPTDTDMKEIEQLMEETEKLADEAEEAANNISIDDSNASTEINELEENNHE